MNKTRNITLSEFIEKASALDESYKDKEIKSIGVNSRNKFIIILNDGTELSFPAVVDI